MNVSQILDSYQQDKPIMAYRMHLRSVFTKQDTGRLIGPRGSHVQKIQEFYKVTVKFSNVDISMGQKRLAHITGKYPDVANAYTYFVEMLYAENINEKCSVDFILPDGFIRFLQDGGGEDCEEEVHDLIDAMAKESHTEIRVYSRFLPDSTERIVCISIPNISCLGDFYNALQILTKHLKENATVALSYPDNVFYQQNDPSSVVSNDYYTNDADVKIYRHYHEDAPIN